MAFFYLKAAWNAYWNHLKLGVSFGILLVFVLLFLFFENLEITSGSVFSDYAVQGISPEVLAVEAVLVLLFLAMYAVLVSLTVLAVRRDYSHLKVEYYLREMIQKFFLKIFFFYTAMILLFLVLVSGAVYLEWNILLVNAFLLVISLLVLFVPQAIVVDEQSTRHSISSSIEFVFKHFPQYAFVVVVSILLVLLIPALEFVVDQYFLVGRFVSLLLVFVFVIPFIEILKSMVYMMRFSLIHHPSQVIQEQFHKRSPGRA
ncbi:MAG: hypothetical protein HY393_00155 [Candidatus Diapherotrites archaeon]|nr:hypothetical protein [Candidatus Diapherotrites archaeon]